MSSKRGRKVNKDLPPSRARDVQRAFRARRAAHLEALEERVAVLEQENSLLRSALKLPPSDRPVLGRGPTGKERPKSVFGSEPPDADSIRRASVSTVSTDASNVSHTRTSHSSSTPSYIHGDQSFEFPHWGNALMIHEEMADSDSSPPVEGPPPPLKLSPVSFLPPQSAPLRSSETNGGVSPGPVHSRSNSYSQSSSSSSAGPDTFSPYPISSPSSAGTNEQSSPYLSRRDSDHLLNISYSRHSPSHGRGTAVEPSSSNGHRRAITEPQTLRALVTEYSRPRANHGAPISAHPIRVPSPPPVSVMDRDTASRKYSLA
ncbi:hypothetical protein BU17DRAFT_62380 [Hysterangium stoloniferum]|nr:hypothetical protein BU17DRAFT_62380 [Hysterangium stoloniferum]